MISLKIHNFEISNNKTFTLITGPCVIENRNHTIKMIGLIDRICKELNINYIFKSSFDKANRSSIKSERGISLNDSLQIFEKIKNEIRTANQKENIFTAEEKELFSKFISKIQKELNINNTQKE